MFLCFFLCDSSKSLPLQDSIKLKTSQLDSAKKFILGKVLIQGNKITKDEVILREMKIKENMPFNLEDIQDDFLRIYNLGLFTKVDIMPLPAGENTVNLLIIVEETYYILPIPIGGFEGGDFKKFWGGVDLRWRNFRGMNETVGSGFALGYKPFISFSYFNPWVGEKSHLFLSGNLKYSKFKNHSLFDSTQNLTLYTENQINDFNIENISASLTIGKYFSYALSSSIQLSFNYTKPSVNLPGSTLNPDGIDKYLSLIYEFNYDTRNLYEYTTNGSLYNVIYNRFGFSSDYFDFNKIKMDLRRYILIKTNSFFELTYAFRVLSVTSFGRDMPSYLKEIIGANDYVRGWKDYFAEGDNKLCLFNEIRIPIIEPYYISGKNIPIVRGISILNRFSYKFGLFGTFFYDLGGVWNKNNNFFKTQFLNGFGTGINLILPFSLVSRFELAYRITNGKLIPKFNINLNSSF